MPKYSGVWTLSQAAQAVKQQNWTAIAPPYVDCLIVAGGGAGGYVFGGGGGAGGMLVGSASVTPGVNYAVTVGAGGTAPSGSQNGTNGNPSSFASVDSLTATGGGRGTYNPDGATHGASGGSGGGGGSYPSTQGAGGTGIPGQGYGGGRGGLTGPGGYNGGGGGGAGSRGQDGSYVSPIAGGGGFGLSCDFSGTRTMYAGGGGGGVVSTSPNDQFTGLGGVGGGGSGQAGTNGIAGTVNTGGGGGGSNNVTGTNGGAGGSGIIIIRYPDFYKDAVSTTATKTTYTGYKVYTFTSTGSITW